MTKKFGPTTSSFMYRALLPWRNYFFDTWRFALGTHVDEISPVISDLRGRNVACKVMRPAKLCRGT